MNDDFVITGDWRKLKNQAWGAVVPSGDEDLTGCDVYLTSKKTGAEARKTLKRRLAIFDDGNALYSLWGEEAPKPTGTKPRGANKPTGPTQGGVTSSLTRELPLELRQLIADALNSEDEDDVYRALQQVATLFGIR